MVLGLPVHTSDRLRKAFVLNEKTEIETARVVQIQMTRFSGLLIGALDDPRTMVKTFGEIRRCLQECERACAAIWKEDLVK